MTEFHADRKSGFPVHIALLRGQLFGSWSTGSRCGPSSKFPIADLRILMPMSMNAVNACRCALMFETAELVYIATVSRNEAAPAGK